MAYLVPYVNDEGLLPADLEERLASQMKAAVTDTAVALQVNGTATGAAIDARINTQVTPVVEQITADYLASDELIVDAAAAAVDANPKIATAVFNGDSRLLERVEAEKPVAFAVVDRHGWVHFDSDDVKPAPTYPSADWAHWGDSLTYTDYSGVPGGWVNQLAALTGRNHFNGGWSGQTTEQIAARQGGIPSMVTVVGNTIPASGSVSVTAANPKPVRQAGSRFVMGSLAGVPGKFQEATTDAVTFTRTTAGVATSCPPGTLFLPDDAPLYADRTVTIWTARNDVYTLSPAAVVERIRAMIQYLTPRVKRILVLEVPPSETSTATHSLLLAINNAIKAAFPEYWVPIATYLRTPEAATAAGIGFTADDQADIAAGITPRSFRVDTMHFNATACTAIASYLYAEAQRRIWL